jgi:outer membrane protein assembly factor BamA
VRGIFTHPGRYCLPRLGCVLHPRFTRAQHQADIADVTRMFQSRGFHAVKVSTDFDPATSFDRRTHTVSFTVHVAERRQTDTEFKGNNPTDFPESALRGQLTFDEAGSADDYELAASALAIQRYYQSHGHFDAQVTYKRESSQLVDHVTFFIDEGPARELRGISFAAVDGPPDAKLAFSQAELEDQVSLRQTSFFGGGGYISPTAQTLADDADRIRKLYVQNGYGDARVAVRVGPDPDHLGSPAVLGALLASDPGGHDLYVRFDIEQGPRTLLDRVEVVFDGPHRGTCTAAIAQLADALDVDLAAHAQGCSVDLTGLAVPTRPDALESAGAKLKDWFWSLGRPRAEATLVVKAAAGDPHHSIATYTVAEHADVRIGKVIVRGNFRTKTSVILDVLAFREGAPLTGELYAAGPRRLRETNLFSAVNLELLGFEESERDQVDVLVRVEERRDVFMQVDLETGYTQINGDYAKGTVTVPNPLHNGISASAALTFPLHWLPPLLFYLPADAKFESLDVDVKVPRWVVRNAIRLPLDSDTQFIARQQDTPRFGQLGTLGFTEALSRVWQRPRSDTRPARSFAATLRYDYRDRQRDQDAIRAIGPNSDATQAPVETVTGSVGVTFVYDRRLDARNNLNPLIPDHGFKVEAGALFASSALGGGADFFKINGSLQVIHTVNDRLQFHLDAKLDQGFPLGGQVLLPEVERFFAGGDTTVRGYAEDRVATELIESAVPPFGNVQQIRVLPAGGNIRALLSVDMQVRVWHLSGIPVATGIFCDSGLVTNAWSAVTPRDIRPAIGVSLFRLLAPFGAISIDYAVPIAPRLGDNPLGFWAVSVALR